MRKFFAALLIIALALSLASCGFKLPSKAGPSPSAAPSASPSETPSASPSPSPSAVDQLLDTEPTAGELGKYLMQHARELTTEDNDKLLERLLLVQLDVSMDMNFKILNEAYMSALNDTMGGVLDPTKISDIKDAAVRGDFQMLFDGMMTVVRYEETPGIETNWSALNRLKDAFSPQAAFVIDYSSRLQGDYYRSESKGPDLMAEDIAAIEAAYAATDAGFLRWQLSGLYTREVATLLFGPEGSYLSDLAAGKKAVLDRLGRYADTYGATNFGRICAGVLSMKTRDQQTVTDLINGSIIFPPGDPRTLELTPRTVKGGAIDVPQIKDPESTPLTQQLNKTIDDAVAGLLVSGAANQQLYHNSAVCGNYLSVTLSCSYTDTSGKMGYQEKNLVLDLTTGQAVTLDALAGKALADYKDALLKAMHGDDVPADLTAPVSFALGGSLMTVSSGSAGNRVYPDYWYVTLNGLRSFMDVSKLY